MNMSSLQSSLRNFIFILDKDDFALGDLTEFRACTFCTLTMNAQQGVGKLIRKFPVAGRRARLVPEI